MSTLSSDAWEAASTYLDHALSPPDEKRTAWLVSLRELEPKLASHLESLLHEHQVLAQEYFLEQEPAPPLSAHAPMAGQTIGPYALVSLIGGGGMGSVCLAERSDGRLQRRAAVKFLRATIRARLTHPHFVLLLDAGVSTARQPYRILEYVEGEDFVQHRDRCRLNAEGRVRPFLDVLATVAHAHANLVVHCDIKSSNVMIAIDGQVKLLDFGIGKLLEGENLTGGATLPTREGARTDSAVCKPRAGDGRACDYRHRCLRGGCFSVYTVVSGTAPWL